MWLWCGVPGLKNIIEIKEVIIEEGLVRWINSQGILESKIIG